MSTRITDEGMTSTTTRHFATRVDADAELWEVSWLPAQLLTRNQAVTAMTLAEVVAVEDMHSNNPKWAFVDNWARELGLTGPDAVVRASTPLEEVQ